MTNQGAIVMGQHQEKQVVRQSNFSLWRAWRMAAIVTISAAGCLGQARQARAQATPGGIVPDQTLGAETSQVVPNQEVKELPADLMVLLQRF